VTLVQCFCYNAESQMPLRLGHATNRHPKALRSPQILQMPLPAGLLRKPFRMLDSYKSFTCPYWHCSAEDTIFTSVTLTKCRECIQRLHGSKMRVTRSGSQSHKPDTTSMCVVTYTLSLCSSLLFTLLQRTCQCLVLFFLFTTIRIRPASATHGT